MAVKKAFLYAAEAVLLAVVLCACSTTSPQQSLSVSAHSAASAPAMSSAASTIADAYGKVNGLVYTNDVAGLSIKLPDGYTILNSPDTIREYSLKKFALRKDQGLYKYPDAQEQLIRMNATPGMIAWIHPDGNPDMWNNELSVTLEKIDHMMTIKAMDMAKIYARNIAQTSDKFKTGNPVAVWVGGGTDGACFENYYAQQNTTFAEKYTVFINGDYVVVLCESSLDTMARNVQDLAMTSLKITPLPSWTPVLGGSAKQ